MESAIHSFIFISMAVACQVHAVWKIYDLGVAIFAALAHSSGYICFVCEPITQAVPWMLLVRYFPNKARVARPSSLKSIEMF